MAWRLRCWTKRLGVLGVACASGQLLQRCRAGQGSSQGFACLGLLKYGIEVVGESPCDDGCPPCAHKFCHRMAFVDAQLEQRKRAVLISRHGCCSWQDPPGTKSLALWNNIGGGGVHAPFPRLAVCALVRVLPGYPEVWDVADMGFTRGGLAWDFYSFLGWCGFGSLGRHASTAASSSRPPLSSLAGLMQWAWVEQTVFSPTQSCNQSCCVRPGCVLVLIPYTNT